jgi:hypothetical protein
MKHGTFQQELPMTMDYYQPAYQHRPMAPLKGLH